MIRPSRRHVLIATFTVAAIAAGGTAFAVIASGRSTGRFDLRTVNSSGGPMVVTGTGITAYIYLPDPTRPSATTCTDDCANDWPPILVSVPQPRLSGIRASLVGVLVRPDHTRQLTLAGYPLYRFAGDHRPGQTYGESIGNTWFAIGPDGHFLALPPVTFQGSAKSSAALEVVSTSLGPVAADGTGETLYTFKDDLPHRSACATSWCTQDWPPIIVQRPITHIAGITATLGVLKRPNGTLQVTLSGHPLYRFAGDVRPGDVRGFGIGGDWYPIAPNGTKIIS